MEGYNNTIESAVRTCFPYVLVHSPRARACSRTALTRVLVTRFADEVVVLDNDTSDDLTASERWSTESAGSGWLAAPKLHAFHPSAL